MDYDNLFLYNQYKLKNISNLDNYFIIEKDWLTKWISYCDSLDKNINNEKFKKIEKPGKISNKRIFTKVINLNNNKSIYVKSDSFSLISEEIWKGIKKLYQYDLEQKYKNIKDYISYAIYINKNDAPDYIFNENISNDIEKGKERETILIIKNILYNSLNKINKKALELLQPIEYIKFKDIYIILNKDKNGLLTEIICEIKNFYNIYDECSQLKLFFNRFSSINDNEYYIISKNWLRKWKNIVSYYNIIKLRAYNYEDISKIINERINIPKIENEKLIIQFDNFLNDGDKKNPDNYILNIDEKNNIELFNKQIWDLFYSHYNCDYIIKRNSSKNDILSLNYEKKKYRLNFIYKDKKKESLIYLAMNINEQNILNLLYSILIKEKNILNYFQIKDFKNDMMEVLSFDKVRREIRINLLDFMKSNNDLKNNNILEKQFINEIKEFISYENYFKKEEKRFIINKEWIENWKEKTKYRANKLHYKKGRKIKMNFNNIHISKINNKNLIINIDKCLNKDNNYYIEDENNIYKITENLWNLFKKHYGCDIEIEFKETLLNKTILDIEFVDDNHNYKTKLLIDKNIIENLKNNKNEEIINIILNNLNALNSNKGEISNEIIKQFNINKKIRKEDLVLNYINNNNKNKCIIYFQGNKKSIDYLNTSNYNSEQESNYLTEENEENEDDKEIEKIIIRNNYNSRNKYVNGLTGLINLGATCFMNATLQLFSNVKELKDYLCNKQYIKDLNITHSNGDITKALSNVIDNLKLNNSINYRYNI